MLTGKYHPSADWVVPLMGQGLDIERANICWKMCLFPEETSFDEVQFVFGKRGDQYYSKNISVPIGYQHP